MEAGNARVRWLRPAFWTLAAAFGLLHAWAYRQDIRDVDGISYLDMGDAYLRGDWRTALNGCWSPLYSWLLAGTIQLIRPSPAQEYPATQLVSLAIFLGALVCFELFLRELIRSAPGTAADRVALPSWTLRALGYSLFIWSALYWHYFWLQAPDLVLAAFVFLAAALLVRIHHGDSRLRLFLALGTILGLAYLTKTALFPLAFVFLGSAVFAAGNLRRGVLHGAAALALFLLVSAPLVIALSRVKGRPTIGDAGRLNYAWHVNGLVRNPHWPHWNGEGGAGAPLRPARRLHPSPAVYDLAAPIGGTYPMWYDPTYWYEGLRPRFDPVDQAKQLARSAEFYFDLFFHGPQPGLFVAAFALFSVSSSKRGRARGLLRHWPLFVPAVAALGLYAVVHVERRYIAPFVLLLWMGLFAGVRLPRHPGWRRMATGALVAAVIVTLAAASLSTLNDLFLRKQEPMFDGSMHARIAAALSRAGLRPGDRVGVVGSGLNAARWARLARARIATELPWQEADAFWNAGRPVQSRAADALCSTGARLVVAERVPRGPLALPWKRITGAEGYAYLPCGRSGRRRDIFTPGQ